jgi:hypothetical protein
VHPLSASLYNAPTVTWELPTLGLRVLPRQLRRFYGNTAQTTPSTGSGGSGCRSWLWDAPEPEGEVARHGLGRGKRGSQTRGCRAGQITFAAFARLALSDRNERRARRSFASSAATRRALGSRAMTELRTGWMLSFQGQGLVGDPHRDSCLRFSRCVFSRTPAHRDCEMDLPSDRKVTRAVLAWFPHARGSRCWESAAQLPRLDSRFGGLTFRAQAGELSPVGMTWRPARRFAPRAIATPIS